MSKTRKMIKSWETQPPSEPEGGVTKPRKEISTEAKKMIKNYESASNETSNQKGDVPKPVKIPGAAKKMIKVYETKEQVKVKEIKEATVAKPDSKKKVLIVYAHGETTSFNSALLAVAEKTFAGMNMEVTVSDLYKMKFNPVCSRNDLTDPKNKNQFKYVQEMGKAYEDGRLVADIVKEQQKLDQADLVIFQFPLQWNSFPAILKGWVDRVLCFKYAYNVGKIFDQARFKGKLAMLSFTTGTPEPFYTPSGIHGDMDVILWPLQGKKAVISFTTGAPETAYTNQGIHGDMNVILWPIQNGLLRFVGFNVLAPQISYDPANSSDKERGALLTAWETRLKTILTEKPIPFISSDKFDLKASMQFNWKALENEGKKTSGPTTGQHMGKPLPANFMTQAPNDEPETPTSPPPTATAPATGSAPTQATPPAQPSSSSQATAPTGKDTKGATGTDSAQPNAPPQEVKTNGK